MIAGILILVAGIFALATSVVLLTHWAQVVLGAALFIRPWVLMFAHRSVADLTASIAGRVAAVVDPRSALALQ